MQTESRKYSIVGQKFGRLLVLSEAEGIRNPGHGSRRRSLVRCDCGKEIIVQDVSLKSGVTKSCGCLRVENRCNVTHGQSTTRTYEIWTGMIKRCTNPKHPFYSMYGGRGITVCERWLKFENFFEDMGECPPLLTLERKDNNFGYSPDNCIWATPKEQARNRRSNRIVTVRGVTGCVAELCERFGVSHSMVRMRLHRGLAAEAAFA
jgi:hypothetical protein